MDSPHTLRRPFLAAVAVAALVLAGCGTSAGTSDKASDATTTTASSDDPTTTTGDGDDDPTTTTEPEGDGGGPSLDDLEALLPTASDLGTGWDEVPADPDDDDDDDDPFGDAMEQGCPALMEFAGDDEEGESVEVEFENTLDQTVNVALSAEAKEIDAGELEGLIDALNGCGEISYTDDDGMETTVTFSGDLDEEFGDQGVRVQGDVSLSFPEMGDPIEFSMYFLNYRIGAVGVSIQGIDGIDSDTLEINGLDPSGVLLDLAAQMQEAVGTL